MAQTRKITNMLHQMMDEGTLDPRAVADAALLWLAEDDVAQMAHDNELLLSQDVDEEDELDEEVEDCEELADRFMCIKDEEYRSVYEDLEGADYERTAVRDVIAENGFTTLREVIEELIG